MNPAAPGDPNDIDAAIARARTAVEFGRQLGIPSAIVDGARFSVEAIDQSPPTPEYHNEVNRRALLNAAQARQGTAQVGYAIVESEALEFLAYLAVT